ncbi:MAG: Mur ligase family protein, partial [Treponema sp.]|nr:Mur ligase family protein [Treponema sp.]
MTSGFVLMDFHELSVAVGGELYVFRDSGVSGFSSVGIDSRTTVPGSLFVALPGESSDGHDFLEAAFSNGAVIAMVERGKLDAALEIAKAAGKAVVAVGDTLRGLQDAARAYLEKFPGLLKIGITGSSGKTTTKEITAAIISTERNTVASRGNYNSETGLPLSVFEVRPEHEVGVFELGMNRVGEMADLAAVLRPDIALVTNTGSSHIGLIGSRRGIAEEKK